MNVSVMYKVLVYCPTYNHSLFIKDAMDGFCMQKTAFPYICCIIDDASIDGTQDVVIKYVENNFDLLNTAVSYRKDTDCATIIHAQHKTNKNCYFAVILLKENHYGKKSKSPYIKEWRDVCEYESMCEGDDYWINEEKLQSQVDFLDTHKDFTICSHRILKYDQDTGIFYKDKLDKLFEKINGVEYNNQTRYWLSETCSTLYRISAEEEFYKYPYRIRDNIHVYFLLKYGKGMCLSKVMGVYRQHQGGVYSKQNTKTKLVDGSYKAMKELYCYENTYDAKILYYRSYAYTILKTKGRLLFMEKFQIDKFISLFYNLFYIFLSKIRGKLPLYKAIPQ